METSKYDIVWLRVRALNHYQIIIWGNEMTDTNFIKTCSKCKESKSVTSFYKIGDGYRSHCIDCMKEKRNEIKSNLIVIIPDAKTCTRCKENKASDDFHHDGTKKMGLLYGANHANKNMI